MALVKVAGSDMGNSLTNLDSATLELTAEYDRSRISDTSIRSVSSEPKTPTHKVSLHVRAGYRDYEGEPADIVRNKQKMSVSAVEPALLRRARKHYKQPTTVLPVESGVAKAVTWSGFRVCEWLRSIDYTKYVPCFKNNFIDGRKLMHFREIKNFPKIGITDFEDMKALSAAIRDLLDVTKPKLYPYENYIHHRSIQDPEEEVYEMYLEDKARNGKIIDKTNFEEYKELYKQKYDRASDMPTDERKWRQHKSA